MNKSLSLICFGLVISSCSLFCKESNAQTIKNEQLDTPVEVSSFEKCKISVDKATNAWRRYYDRMDTDDTNDRARYNLSVCDFGLDFTDVINSCQQPAEEGNAEAQFYVGYASASDYCKKPDFVNAKVWLEKSADQNFPHALSYLGDLYTSEKKENNKVIIKCDTKQYIEYFSKSAMQNELDGIKGLAMHYNNEHNYSKAVEYYKKAYELGDAKSAWKLGDLEIILNNNINKALNWYEKAGELTSDLQYTNDIARIYEKGEFKVFFFDRKNNFTEKTLNIKQNKEKAKQFYKLSCSAIKNNNGNKVFGILPISQGKKYSNFACKQYKLINN